MSDRAEVSLTGSRRIDFTSGVNGRRYSISLGLPLRSAPSRGFPVIYVLDGDAYFASVVEAVRAYHNDPDILVVGIGYPNDAAFVNGILTRHTPLPPYLAELPRTTAAFSIARLYDLTLPASAEALSEQTIGGLLTPTTQDVGGLDDFLLTLKREVMPRVAATVRIDHSNQAIFGHSLGGLAVLHLLFGDPSVFRTYIAASPSIWWNRRAVLAGEEAFAAAVRNHATDPRVLVTMGEDEDRIQGVAAKLRLDPDDVARAGRRFRMVENARELTARLRKLPGSPRYNVAGFALFPHLGHSLSPWPAMAHAIPFAFDPQVDV